MARKPGKSESLTIRLDPKTRFMLDFIARLRGQSITTVVERAIYDAASRATIGQGYGEEDWEAFWSVSEGIRALKLARERALFPTFEELRRLDFCLEHWPFFFTSSKGDEFRPALLDILWPEIDDLVEMHETRKREDYFAAGKFMQRRLSSANIAPPDWPIGSGKKIDIDDEIPF